MHLYSSGDGNDSDGTSRRAFHSGERVLAGVQARRNNITDLAPLEARYAFAKANVREVMQRMQQLNRRYHQVWLHVQVAGGCTAAGRPCLHAKVCMHGGATRIMIRDLYVCYSLCRSVVYTCLYMQTVSQQLSQQGVTYSALPAAHCASKCIKVHDVA
jgi:hypothetical protein